MPRLAAVPASQLFRTEVAEASSLGYTVKVAHAPATPPVELNSVITVRLVPETDKAKAVARNAGGTALEAVSQYQDPRDQGDAIREALRACLDRARNE